MIVVDTASHSLSLNNSPPESVRLTGPSGEVIESDSFTPIPADQSSARSPDVTGSFVNHKDAAAGTPASPGKCLGGAVFPGCYP